MSHTSELRASVTNVAFTRSPAALMGGSSWCEFGVGFGEVEEWLKDETIGAACCPSCASVVPLSSGEDPLDELFHAWAFSKSAADCMRSAPGTEDVEDPMKKMTTSATTAKRM